MVKPGPTQMMGFLAFHRHCHLESYLYQMFLDVNSDPVATKVRGALCEDQNWLRKHNIHASGERYTYATHRSELPFSCCIGGIRKGHLFGWADVNLFHF